MFRDETIYKSMAILIFSSQILFTLWYKYSWSGIFEGSRC